MTAHELAELLLRCPDLPVALHVNGHTYSSTDHAASHGPLQIGRVSGNYGRTELVIGDMLGYRFSDDRLLHDGRGETP